MQQYPRPRGYSSSSSEEDEEGAIYIDTYDYFEHVFGFQERSVQEVYELTKPVMLDDGSVQLETPNGPYAVGRFEVVSVAELEERASKVDKAPRKGTFNLICGEGVRSRNFAGVDVGAIQMEPENHGALFQVASNFNCLEFISSHDSARRGITKYVSDHTQGPAASISCAPATLYRNYFVPHSTPAEEEGQPPRQHVGQLEQQINLLEAVPLVPIRNGYVKFGPDSLERLHREGRGIDWKAQAQAVRVGLQWEAQVTSGAKGHRLSMCQRPEQRVSQLFSAAMDLGGWGNPSDDPLVVAAACMLLRAAYRATFFAARLNAAKSPRCFLTLMGGGVFHNKPSWIVDEIVAGKQLMLDAGCDFYLVLFNGSDEVGERQYGRLEKLVKATGGTIKHV